MLLQVALLCFSLLASFNVAAKVREPLQADGKVRSLMHTFYGSLIELKPFMVSDQAFEKKENREEILRILRRLERKANGRKPKPLKRAGFKVTYDLLERHISSTRELFEAGQYDYARIKLNATTQLCIACHTQLPESKMGTFDWWKNPTLDLEQTSIENADFYFISHRYERALNQYNKLVRHYPANKISEENLDEIYRKKLAIFARIKRDPQRAVHNLSEDLKNKKLPVAVQRNVESWIESFKSWKDEQGPSPESLKPQQLVNFVKKQLHESLGGRAITVSHPHVVTYLRLSGLLYEQLFERDNGKTTPLILYHLAQIEKQLRPLFFYSLADVYLKNCISEYPKSSVAPKCFEKYKQSLEDRYKGQIPESVQASIKALEDKVISRKKSK